MLELAARPHDTEKPDASRAGIDAAQAAAADKRADQAESHAVAMQAAAAEATRATLLAVSTGAHIAMASRSGSSALPPMAAVPGASSMVGSIVGSTSAKGQTATAQLSLRGTQSGDLTPYRGSQAALDMSTPELQMQLESMKATAATLQAAEDRGAGSECGARGHVQAKVQNAIKRAEAALEEKSDAKALALCAGWLSPSK